MYNVTDLYLCQRHSVRGEGTTTWKLRHFFNVFLYYTPLSSPRDFCHVDTRSKPICYYQRIDTNDKVMTW